MILLTASSSREELKRSEALKCNLYPYRGMAIYHQICHQPWFSRGKIAEDSPGTVQGGFAAAGWRPPVAPRMPVIVDDVGQSRP